MTFTAFLLQNPHVFQVKKYIVSTKMTTRIAYPVVSTSRQLEPVLGISHRLPFKIFSHVFGDVKGAHTMLHM